VSVNQKCTHCDARKVTHPKTLAGLLRSDRVANLLRDGGHFGPKYASRKEDVQHPAHCRDPRYGVKRPCFILEAEDKRLPEGISIHLEQAEHRLAPRALRETLERSHVSRLLRAHATAIWRSGEVRKVRGFRG